LDPTRRSFKYSWSRDNTDGDYTSKDVNGAPPDGWFPGDSNTVVMTGSAPLEGPGEADMLRIIVDPLVTVVAMPDARGGRRADVHMAYQHAPGQLDVDDHIFIKGDNAWVWRQFIADVHNRRFMWWAEYYLKPSGSVTMGTQTNPFQSEAETVILEPPQ